jgi:hypothetical protein
MDWFLHISKLKNSNRWNLVGIVWFTEKLKLFKVIVDNNTFLLNVANNFKVNCNFLITFSGWADLSQPWKTLRMPSSKNPTTTSSNRVLPNVAIEFRHENAIMMKKQLSLHLVSLLTCLVTRIQPDINEFFFFFLLFKLDRQWNSNSIRSHLHIYKIHFQIDNVFQLRKSSILSFLFLLYKTAVAIKIFHNLSSDDLLSYSKASFGFNCAGQLNYCIYSPNLIGNVKHPMPKNSCTRNIFWMLLICSLKCNLYQL